MRRKLLGILCILPILSILFYGLYIDVYLRIVILLSFGLLILTVLFIIGVHLLFTKDGEE